MKFLSLVLCVGMLCITTASRGLPSSQPHHLLHKRQANSDDACDAAILNDQCMSGFAQSYITVIIECGVLESIEGSLEAAKACESSSSGTLCGGVNTFTLSDTVTTTCGSSPTSCSSDCQDLLTTTRAQLGCCINYLNNTEYFGSTDAFDNSLWSLCNVELVTEETQCAPGPVQVPETIIMGPTCNASSLNARLNDEAFCQTQYMESRHDPIAEYCESDPFEDYCIVNEQGEYCENAYSDSNSFIFTAASTNCAYTSTCDPLCIQSLNNITSCCFIHHYNGTSVTEQLDWLSYEFWSLCGLDSPGFCESKFNNAAAILKAPGIAVILAIALMVLQK